MQIRYIDPITDARAELEVDRVAPQEVRPLRGGDYLIADVRETDAVERRLVADKPYAAVWLGWSRGCTPGYGASPEEAVRNLAAGKVAR